MNDKDILKRFHNPHWDYKIICRNPMILCAIPSSSNLDEQRKAVVFHVCGRDAIGETTGVFTNDGKCGNCGIKAPNICVIKLLETKLKLNG